MNRWSPKAWLGGATATLLAMSVMAEPPIANSQNRSYGNSVSAGICFDIDNGYICRDLSAWENYDVKGDFQFSEAAISNYRYTYDPDDGSWSSGWRYLSCPIDESAISAHPNSVTLETTLDPEGFGCYSYGYLESWDPINDYQFVPWPFPGPRDVVGEWADPFSYGQSMINQMDTFYDGWSGTKNTSAQHCQHRWGDMMRSGGFSIGIRSYVFEGPEGPAWSNFSVNSCNDRNMQR